MENIKKLIIDIIRNYKEDEYSSTGITGEKIIYGCSDENISDDITNLIQIIFDPENQPNQLGIENPFEQERGYSKEEVIIILQKYRYDLSSGKTPNIGDTTQGWFEQFKKK